MESLPSELEISLTADGSPTICFSAGAVQEKMHNSQGALSESLYIYGQGLARAREFGSPLRVISVGLGLGYNEMIAFAFQPSLHLWSFEKNDFLRESFRRWVVGEGGVLNSTYDQILRAVAQSLAVPALMIKAALAQALAAGTWQLRGEFPGDVAGVSAVNCVLFDAYSSKTSPELWDEDCLRDALAPLLDARCVFTTYASTGSLRRALLSLGFSLSPRLGFAGKRESTLGIRGL